MLQLVRLASHSTSRLSVCFTTLPLSCRSGRIAWAPHRDVVPGGISNTTLRCAEDVQAAIDQVKATGMKVGVALKPGTAAEEVLPFLPALDMVLVMTVEPGFGGQKFMQDMMPKVRWALQCPGRAGAS